DGDVITGFADMMLYELAFPKQMRRSKMREALDRTDAILCDANLPVGALRERGLCRGVITAGESAVIGFDGDELFSIEPPKARKVVDVTGAGDALAGATTVAMLRGLPLRQALREGVAAAVLAVESDKSAPELSQ